MITRGGVPQTGDFNPALRRALDESDVGIYSFDFANGHFELDAACRRLFGIEPAEVLSVENLAARIHPADLARYREAVAGSMTTGVFACDYRVVHRDGDIRYVSGRGHLEKGPAGTPPRVHGICIDATKLRSLERELKSTEARMQDLADGVPGLFAYVDRDLKIRFLSRQYDTWFGHSRGRHLGQHITTVISAASWVDREPLYARCLAGEAVQYDETRTMTTGEQRNFAVTYHPHRNSRGEVVGILSLAMDVTQQRQAQQALERQSAELARSNHDLEQFAYVASHDLKAPLRAIDVLVEWLEEDLASYTGGEVRQNLGLLKQRTGRLHRLLDDLLAYSRTGRKPGDTGEVDTRQLVEDLFVLLAPPDTMTLVADQSLPVMHAHYAPLEQVLRNLINNAIKHHPSRDGAIRVHAQDKGDEVLFAVEDDGAGIPDEFAEKVFQMFQTLKPRDEVEGSGMGLAIVKRIVEWQGGRIWLHGGPGGRGAVFKFTWKKLVPESGTGGETGDGHGKIRADLAG
ncbi:MAG: PAS domain S-box protein [Gammaproteobacteria bacterium PRO9]|nr:PAS domain S-box protein [Gammaproteobacteria bacterium PRO9]